MTWVVSFLIEGLDLATGPLTSGHQNIPKTTTTMSFRALSLFVLINLPGSQMHSGYHCKLVIHPSWDKHMTDDVQLLTPI